jgi:hypothetical protein
MKDLFNFRLFYSGLRQTMFAGILLSITVIGLSVLLSLDSSFSILFERFHMYEYMNWFTIFYRLLLLSIPIILSIILFSIYNQEDLYCNLPLKRSTIFFTYLFNIIFWIFFITLMMSFINLRSDFISNINVFLRIFFSLFLILSMTLFSLSITRIKYISFVIGLSLLFIPNLIISLFDNALNSLLIITDTSELFILKLLKINIPLNLLIGNPQENILLETIYTLCFSFMYLIFAFVFYKKRRLENSQNNSNKILHNLCRCLFVLPLSIFIPYSWLTGNKDKDYLLLIFVTIILYLVFEIITIRHLRKLIFIPIFLFVILFNLLFYFGVLATKTIILNNIPSADEIESVYLFVAEDEYDVPTYTNLKLQEIAFNEKEIKEIVSEQLRTTVNMLSHKDDYDYFYSLGERKYHYSIDLGEENYYDSTDYGNKIVTIKTKSGKNIKREILFSTGNSPIFDIIRIREKNESYNQALYSLPKDEEITEITCGDFSASETKKIWELFKHDWESIKKEDKISLDNEEYPGGNQYNYPALTHIIIEGKSNGKSFKTSYPVSVLSPKALRECFNDLGTINPITNDKFPLSDFLYYLLNRYNAISELNFELNLREFLPDFSNPYKIIISNGVITSYQTPNELKEIFEILVDAIENNNFINFPYVYSVEGNSNYLQKNINTYLSLSENQAKRIKELNDVSLNRYLEECKNNTQDLG